MNTSVIRGLRLFIWGFILGSLLRCTEPRAEEPYKVPQFLPEALVVLTFVDYLQTRQITYECRMPNSDRAETNPILGHCPSIGKVNNYFLLSTALAYGMVKYGPEELRPYIAGGWLGVELWAVGNNINIGLKARF